ncbi:hypothetical protein HYT45_02890 [Candidatus Uhrbacteria bacterium]|nr:hypothetical protein [Candidatus Uhrbacteria bacterium]
MPEEEQKDLEISFPEDILKMAQEFKMRRLEKEIRKIREEFLRRQEAARLKTERVKTGLAFAKKVFAWAKSFRESEAGKELMRVSHIPTDYQNIFFFDGHVAGTEWVELVVTPQGLFLDNDGKMSCLFRKEINSPRELAASLDTRILKESCEWIDDGRVWECIKRRFAYLDERESKRRERKSKTD